MIDFEKKVKISVDSEKYDNSEALAASVGVDAEDDEDIKTQHETIKFMTEGTLSSKNGKVTLNYDDSELFEGEQTGVSLIFEASNPGLVSMLRGGSVSTAMVFESGKRHICVYTTPFMTFEVCINTSRVVNKLLSDGTLELEYSIEVHGVSAERTRMKVRAVEM